MSNGNKNTIKNIYTVGEFCLKYNGTNVDQAKDAFIQKIMNPQYVPYEKKITICEKIIESSYYKTIERNGEKVKKLHVNSPAQYMLYCLFLVDQYTCLKVDFKNSLKEFNLLNQNDLLDTIYSNIPEKELKEFSMILDMVESDTIQNEYETQAFISNQVERFGELFGAVAKPAFERLSEILENMDEKTVDSLIDKLKGLNGLKEKFNIVK